jgi:ubiquinone/menaquinone biosynthesis C-methylase UbiE
MLVPALEGHRIWAACYQTTPNPLLALEARLLPEIIGPVSLRRVVDVACGTGRWAARLAEWGADVIGIDFCAEMLEHASVSVRDRLVLGDAGCLPIRPGTADLTICSFAAAYFPDLERAISEMARITKPGGRVIVTDLHPAGVEAGWTRSFRIDRVIYELEHFGYSLEQMDRASRRAGLELECERHARFGEPEKAIFQAAGKAGSWNTISEVPALWIGSWRMS